MYYCRQFQKIGTCKQTNDINRNDKYEIRNTTCGLVFQNSSTCKSKLLFLDLNVKSKIKLSTIRKKVVKNPPVQW